MATWNEYEQTINSTATTTTTTTTTSSSSLIDSFENILKFHWKKPLMHSLDTIGITKNYTHTHTSPYFLSFWPFLWSFFSIFIYTDQWYKFKVFFHQKKKHPLYQHIHSFRRHFICHHNNTFNRWNSVQWLNEPDRFGYCPVILINHDDCPIFFLIQMNFLNYDTICRDDHCNFYFCMCEYYLSVYVCVYYIPDIWTINFPMSQVCTHTHTPGSTNKKMMMMMI